MVDNLASLTPGIDENSKKDWDPINQWLLEPRFAGISTIMLHHTNKDGGQRGTSAREDNIDTSIMLRHPPGYQVEDGCRFIVEFKKNRVVSSDQFLLADREFSYSRGLWLHSDLKVNNKHKVLKLLDQGMTQKDIAELIGTSGANVSQIRARAIKDGFLTEKNKLTQSGFTEIHDEK